MEWELAEEERRYTRAEDTAQAFPLTEEGILETASQKCPADIEGSLVPASLEYSASTGDGVVKERFAGTVDVMEPVTQEFPAGTGGNWVGDSCLSGY